MTNTITRLTACYVEETWLVIWWENMAIGCTRHQRRYRRRDDGLEHCVAERVISCRVRITIRTLVHYCSCYFLLSWIYDIIQ